MGERTGLANEPMERAAARRRVAPGLGEFGELVGVCCPPPRTYGGSPGPKFALVWSNNVKFVDESRTVFFLLKICMMQCFYFIFPKYIYHAIFFFSKLSSNIVV